MPHLEINDRFYHVDTQNLIEFEAPEDGRIADSFFQSNNATFTDEVAFKLGDQYYLAHFSAEANLPEFNNIRSLYFIADTFEGESARIEGEVLWIDDEPDDEAQLKEVEINFGYVNEQHEWIEGDWVESALGAGELADLKELLLRKTHFYFKEDHVTKANYQRFKSRIHRKLEKHTCVISTQVEWINNNEIKVIFHVTPPAKDIIPEINFYSPDGSTLSEGDESRISEKIRSHFKDRLTSRSIFKSRKKLAQELENDPKYQFEFNDPFFNEAGGLVFPVKVRPVYQSVTIYIEKQDQNGQPISKHQFNAESIGIQVAHPLNKANLRKSLQAVLSHYDSEGFFAMHLNSLKAVEKFGEEALNFTGSSFPVPITVRPAPRHFVFNSNVGPNMDVVKRKFKDSKSSYFTHGSASNGAQWLRSWYAKKGYVLNTNEQGVDIAITTQEGKLYVECEARKLEGYFIKTVDHGAWNEEKLAWFQEKGEEILLREFQTEAGDFFNTHDFHEAMERINSRYPFHVEYKLESNDETGDIKVNFQVSDNGRLRIQNRVDGDSFGFGDTISASLKTNGGNRITASASASGLPTSYSTLGFSAGYKMPLLNKSGTALDLHAGGARMLKEPYHSQSIGFSVDQPIGGPHSAWSLLAGYDLERLAVNGEIWNKPFVGVQYNNDGTVIRITVGPRVSFNGNVYGEISIYASKRIYLTRDGKLFLKAQAEAGLRVGAQPEDFLSTLFSETGNSPLMLYFKAKVGILYQISPGLAVGLGIGFSTFGLNGSPVLGAGLMIKSRDLELLIGPGWDPIAGGRLTLAAF